MNDTNIKARARVIIDSTANGVLITLDDKGFPHPRTMWTAGIDEDFTVYFLTGRDLLKSKQIANDQRVCIFWTKADDLSIGWDYAFLKGEAAITDDQSLRDRFWDDSLTQYFPGGKTDPSYVVIVIKPKELMIMDGHKYPLDKMEF
ncbi:MAG: pyridoxamine 5'-phosphate oxidase family protein [Armatimonadetes bacterium]|nr:pyridoxamine 5'-phosphate oxidase family protein [Armatimonadota bacterium]